MCSPPWMHFTPTPQMPKVIPVGPLLPSAPFSKQVDTTKVTTELDQSIMRFLDKQPRRSVVYIAFGTVGILNNEKLFQEVALGLEASGQSFLCAEGPSVHRPDAKTLIQSLPPGFEERTRERGMVVIASAPQLRILHHQAVPSKS